MIPSQAAQARPTKDHVMLAAETLYFVGVLCRSQGVDVCIEFHDLPREAFDSLDDSDDDSYFKYLSFAHPERPLWWKRFANFMFVYTYEPPPQETKRL